MCNHARWALDGRYVIFVYHRYDSPYLHFVEICSAHPTSGGPYYWAAMLSDPENAPLTSWITGWFNLLGQVAVTTGIRY